MLGIFMEIGWIDFSKNERSKILSVLDLLGEKGVLDELGISQIRDGYSDLFFPGTSTIQMYLMLLGIWNSTISMIFLN